MIEVSNTLLWCKHTLLTCWGVFFVFSGLFFWVCLFKSSAICRSFLYPGSPRSPLGLLLLLSFCKLFTLFQVIICKMSILTATWALKWMLILASVASNNTLVWKIWKRKSLHTIFNLSFCFYFFWSGMFGPFLFYEYGTLLDEMIKHPDTSCPTLCHRVLVYRILICQALKVFIINILYR
jgi:hypothetical protein